MIHASLFLALAAAAAIGGASAAPIPALSLRGNVKSNSSLLEDITVFPTLAGATKTSMTLSPDEKQTFYFNAPGGIDGSIVHAGIVSQYNPAHNHNLPIGYVNLLSVTAQLKDCSSTGNLCEDTNAAGFCSFKSPSNILKYFINTQATKMESTGAPFIEITQQSTPTDDDQPLHTTPIALNPTTDTDTLCPATKGVSDSTPIQLIPYLKTSVVTVTTTDPVTFPFASADAESVSVDCTNFGNGMSLSILVCPADATDCDLFSSTPYPSDLTPIGNSHLVTTLVANSNYVLRLFNTGADISADPPLPHSLAQCYLTTSF